MKAAAVYALLLCFCSPAIANEWQTIRNCRLIENESNDGDSFHVKADGEERIFRLYFVDTPEAESGGYVEGRVGEQAKSSASPRRNPLRWARRPAPSPAPFSRVRSR